VALTPACESDSDGGTPAGGGDTAGGGTDATGGELPSTYEPFSQANLQNQLVRVGAYEQIQTLRKGESFAAADFGTSCASFSPDVDDPSDPTKVASLYIESASLAEKVAGRKDDHAYNEGAEVGKAIDAAICDAIAMGSAVPDTVGKDDVAGLGWYGQIVDKALQHFFYHSVYHEMVQGARSKWDEGFGYFGMPFDGDTAKAEGIAKTAVSRDENCGTTYAGDIWEKLIEGRVLLDRALTDAGKTGNDDALDALPADLQAVIDEVDQMMLEVFAISFAREFIGMAAGDKPAIKLIEGRMFFHILEPSIRAKDAALADEMKAQLEQDDPSKVDTDAMIAAVKTVYGIDVPALCAE
jgi:hypothetical protein